MSAEVFNRYEKKYMIDYDMYKLLLEQLSAHMIDDKYNFNKEFYTISNIYYDTEDDRLIRRSIEKPVYKEKLRVRGYGAAEPDTEVFLEIKKKYKGMVNKRRISIPLKDAYKFIEMGELRGEKIYNTQIVSELEYFINIYGRLFPKVLIAYDRKAFLGINEPDLRVTFDTNIRARRDNVRLEAGDYGEMILPQGVWLMEIKSINSMPMWLVDILNVNNIRSNSFSKYGTEYIKNMLKNKEINYAEINI